MEVGDEAVELALRKALEIFCCVCCDNEGCVVCIGVNLGAWDCVDDVVDVK